MDFPKRKRTRLRDYDYNSAGAYFITVCTHNQRNTLCHVSVGAIHESPVITLTEQGRVVDEVISTLPSHLGATIDRYVIMPNHLHLVVVITSSDAQRAIRESPLRTRSVLSNVIGYIKMNASKRIRQTMQVEEVWQRGYHDHIIRNREDYRRIATYIQNNPARWRSDCFYKA